MNQDNGAVWIKMSNKGEEYFSGVIKIDGKDIRFAMFQNKYKKNDNQPDFRILLSDNREIDPRPLNTIVEKRKGIKQETENIPF